MSWGRLRRRLRCLSAARSSACGSATCSRSAQEWCWLAEMVTCREWDPSTASACIQKMQGPMQRHILGQPSCPEEACQSRMPAPSGWEHDAHQPTCPSRDATGRLWAVHHSRAHRWMHWPCVLRDKLQGSASAFTSSDCREVTGRRTMAHLLVPSPCATWLLPSLNSTTHTYGWPHRPGGCSPVACTVGHRAAAQCPGRVPPGR